MQLKWLEDFVALAQERSFTRAAELRHVTHPAFGRRIKALESWLGVALVNRGMGVSLVPQSLSRSKFGNVRYLEIDEAEAEHRVSLLWHKDNHNDLLPLFSKIAAQRVG